MKKVRIVVMVGILTSLLAIRSPIAFADHTQPAAADTYVRQTEPDMAHDNDGLGVAMFNFPIPDNESDRTYVQFDLSGNWSGTLTSATLRLYLLGPSSGNAVIGVYPTTWVGDEGITWNTQPGPSGAMLDSQAVVGGVGAWVEFDVTSEVTLGSVVSFMLRDESAEGFGAVSIFEDSENSKSSGNTPELFLEGPTPTAVDLASFTAQAGTGSGVTIHWETASELDNLGFHLYRATAADGVRIRLNADLIPARAPGSATGAAYQFADTTAAAGRTYYYWLEDVDIHGAATLQGPVSATAPAAWRLILVRQRPLPYLPLHIVR